MTSALPKLYTAWFCPFAQRAWIALLYKNIEFEYIEQDPYDKTPEWLSVNPRGLVPVIVVNGQSVIESGICVQYVEDAWPQNPRILPTDPIQRAQARIWSDHIDKKIVPHFYAALVKQNTNEQQDAYRKFVSGLDELFSSKKHSDKFLMGNDVGMVDIMIFPWICRFPVLKTYREFELPEGGIRDKVKSWEDHMMSISAVKSTVPETGKMLDIYKRYATDTAQTQVAEAIRKGTALP